MKPKIQKQKISHFFTNEYAKKYVKYVCEERAIPSIIDGFKPSYRKSLHAALSFMKKGISVSGIEIVGETYKRSAYHHGNSSLEDVVIKHGADYLTNSSPLVISGSGGDLRNNDASAIRYLKFILSDNASLYKHDLQLLEHNYDGDKQIEPKFYLPLIPLVLASRGSGTAVAYAFANNMSYSLKSIAETSLISLENLGRKKQIELPKMKPYVDGYDGRFEYVGEDKWKSFSEYSIKGNKVTILGLPVDQTYDKFEKNLSTLLDKGKILNFTNEGTKGVIKYVVNFNATDLTRLKKNNCIPLEKLLKLTSVSAKNTYTFIDENQNVLTDIVDVYGVVNYFVRYRLTRYNDRKKFLLADIKKRISEKSDLSRFIKFVIDKKLVIQNRPIKEIKKFLTDNKITHNVLTVSVTKLTKEEYEKLLKEIKMLEKEHSTIKSTTITNMYKKDLKELIKSL